LGPSVPDMASMLAILTPNFVIIHHGQACDRPIAGANQASTQDAFLVAQLPQLQ
jgi:hypothetical protein